MHRILLVELDPTRCLSRWGRHQPVYLSLVPETAVSNGLAASPAARRQAASSLCSLVNDRPAAAVGSYTAAIMRGGTGIWRLYGGEVSMGWRACGCCVQAPRRTATSG